MNIFTASKKSLTKLFMACALMSLALFLVSCAGSHMITKDVKPELEAKSGDALLVIVRTTSLGWAVTIDNYLDGKMIGETRGKSYFITDVKPGIHYVMAHAENMATARITFDAERIYFLQQSIYPGFWKARTGFSVLTYEEAIKEINDGSSEFRVYDSGHPAEDLSEKDFQEAKEDFEREAKEDPERHKDTLEYKGYNKMK